jgi:hypothetical protein
LWLQRADKAQVILPHHTRRCVVVVFNPLFSRVTLDHFRYSTDRILHSDQRETIFSQPPKKPASVQWARFKHEIIGQ